MKPVSLPPCANCTGADAVGTTKTRLDQLLVKRELVESREKAKALIMAGQVLVDDRPVTKAGSPVAEDAVIRLRGQTQYVSRGGEKLAGALDALSVDPAGLRLLDIGQSTGGFTDCLLQRGAVQITGVDVGYGQLANKLRQDERVTCLERTNARTLPADAFDGEQFDGAVVDVSFISLRTVLPPVLPHVREGGFVVAMVKPQFEAGRENVKKGVVRDPAIIVECSDLVAETTAALGWIETGRAAAPIQGPKGNQEVFLLLTRRTS
jgi:23S rRNA (cytidine1920-2'-O)/16S rRNA (cytidine1409-2'-O)-methyltransferase